MYTAVIEEVLRSAEDEFDKDGLDTSLVEELRMVRLLPPGLVADAARRTKRRTLGGAWCSFADGATDLAGKD